jgi:hypothetical protein
MNIAIIGAGNVGRALATSFVRAGHTVTVASRDPEHSGAVASSTHARSAASNAAAAATAEIVVLAIPFGSVEAVAAEIATAVKGKIVVDATNRMAFGPNGPTIDAGPSNAERLAAWLPDAHVVKAFNTLFASHQADPMAEGVQLDGFVAADDAVAGATIIELVRSMGLNPVHVGPLSRAQQLEQLAFLNIALNVTGNGSWTSGWKLVSAPSLAHAA